MYDLFIEYQKLFKYSDKLNFLTSQYNNETSEDKKIAITCLIDIEQKAYFPIDHSLLEFHESELKKRFTNNNDYWWGNFTLALINLRNRKLDKDSCNETVQLLELVQEVFVERVPSFLLFFMAHAYFEKSKVQNNTIDAITSLEQARDTIGKLCEDYSNLLDANPKYHALVMNFCGNISMKEDSFRRQEDLLRDTKEDFLQAEIYYKRAKDLDETFEYPYNGLGSIYRERFDFKKAIYYYNKAIKYNKEFMYPWNFLGDCFRILEVYDVALKCYSRALECCNDYSKNKLMPLYGVGRVYYELGNRNNFAEKYIKRAEFYFNKAEAYIDEDLPQARFILKDKARILQKKEFYNEAKGIFESIRDNKLFFNQIYYQNIITEYINVCNSMHSIREACKKSNENCTNSSSNLLKNIMCEIDQNGIEKRALDMKELFDVEFLKRNKISETEFKEIKSQCRENEYLSSFFDIDRGNNNFFQVLRRWNSYTPIINSGRGGGYFLKIDGVGIVIDPGFNFIKNYKEVKNYFRDIDIVLISHAHDDHTADMESILNLQYRYNKRLENVALVREIAKEYGISAGDIEQQEKINDVAKTNFSKLLLKRFNERKNKIVAYMSPGAEIKFSSFFRNNSKTQKDTSSDSYRSIINKNKESEKTLFYKVVYPGDNIEVSENCKISTIKAIHDDLIQGQQCLGFVISLPSVIIVYTGDTGWYRNKTKESLEDEYTSIYNQAKQENKRIILVAHLGGFKENEINFWRQNEKEMFYDNHLGRIGLYKAVETLNPEVCIVSEFGEEFNGMRMRLTDIFNNAFEKAGLSTVFLPGDIGLTLNLDTSCSLNTTKLKVISHIDFKNRTIKYDYTEPHNVGVGEYRFSNLIFFYKKDCFISEGDIVQAFIDGFTDESESIEITI